MIDNAIVSISNKNLNVKSIGLYLNNKERYHHFEKGKFDIRSISKTIMSIVCLHVIEKY